MKRLQFSLLILFSALICFSQKKTDKKLQSQIEEAINGFNGDIGIYVKNLRTGKTIAINADSVFPTASIVKVPILIGIMDKIEKGELLYDSAHVYKDSLLYAGEDILGSFKDGEKIILEKLIMLMLTMSDNTASLWLQNLAGTGTRINTILDSSGFRHTKVNSRTPGRENNRAIYGWGQTTPREIATLLEMIYLNKLFSPVACENMMRYLSRNYWDEQALSQIPPYIQVFSKHGALDEVRSEVLLVNAPHNPYIFCIFTKNNKDTSWRRQNEAWILARKTSRILWDYYESKDKWESAKK